MLQHVLTIASQLAISDQISQLASYINALDGFTFSQLPAPAPPFAVTTLWYSSVQGTAVESRHRVISPSGKEIYSVPLLGGVFAPGQSRFRQHNMIAGFLISEQGDHWIVAENKIDGKWHEGGRIPLQVVIAKPTPATSDAGAVNRVRASALPRK